MVYVFNDEDGPSDIPAGWYFLGSIQKHVSDGLDISVSARPLVMYSLYKPNDRVATIDGSYIFGGGGGEYVASGTAALSIDTKTKKGTWLSVSGNVGFGYTGSELSGATYKGGAGYKVIFMQPWDPKKHGNTIIYLRNLKMKNKKNPFSSLFIIGIIILGYVGLKVAKKYSFNKEYENTYNGIVIKQEPGSRGFDYLHLSKGNIVPLAFYSGWVHELSYVGDSISKDKNSLEIRIYQKRKNNKYEYYKSLDMIID